MLYQIGLGCIGFTSVVLLAHVAVAYPVFRAGGFFLLALVCLAIVAIMANRAGVVAAQLKAKFAPIDAIAANAAILPAVVVLVVAIAVGIWSGIRG